MTSITKLPDSSSPNYYNLLHYHHHHHNQIISSNSTSIDDIQQTCAEHISNSQGDHSAILVNPDFLLIFFSRRYYYVIKQQRYTDRLMCTPQWILWHNCRSILCMSALLNSTQVVFFCDYRQLRQHTTGKAQFSQHFPDFIISLTFPHPKSISPTFPAFPDGGGHPEFTSANNQLSSQRRLTSRHRPIKWLDTLHCENRKKVKKYICMYLYNMYKRLTRIWNMDTATASHCSVLYKLRYITHI